MEALEFLKEYRRMCSTSDEYCSGCPLIEKGCLSTGMRVKSDSQFMTITCAVEQWSKEHPITTNSKKFEEVFGFLMEDKYVVSAEVLNWLKKPYEEIDHDT